MTQHKFLFLITLFICANVSDIFAQPDVQKGRKTTHRVSSRSENEQNHGSVVTERFVSEVLRETRTGLDSDRSIKIYLPPSYSRSHRSYPVVYYCHSIFQNPEQLLADGNLIKLLERGFANGIVKEFIFVVGDYTSPTTGSLYENSRATGRWLDYTVQELVPFVDRKFRQLRQ